jgi:hypothetical protein
MAINSSQPDTGVKEWRASARSFFGVDLSA